MRKLSIALASLVAMLVVTSAQARDQIKIVGSSTVFPYATIVAERFGSSGKFKTPVIESTGTGGGAKLFCAGVGTEHPDITNASRAMKAKEYALCQKNGVEEIVEITVGNDGITLAYSKDAKPVNFTKKQLWAALAKEVAKDGALVPNPYKNWSDIDPSLPNYPIKVMVPPGTSGTRDAWNSLVMKKGIDDASKKAGAKYKALREDGAVIEVGENDSLIIQKLAADKEMFGFFGFSYFLAAKERDIDTYKDFKNITDLILFDSVSMEISKSIPKSLLSKLPKGDKFGLAGSINSKNVLEYSQLGFNFLDLSSGLENKNLKGYKDHRKIKSFINKIDELKN